MEKTRDKLGVIGIIAVLVVLLAITGIAVFPDLLVGIVALFGAMSMFVSLHLEKA